MTGQAQAAALASDARYAELEHNYKIVEGAYAGTLAQLTAVTSYVSIMKAQSDAARNLLAVMATRMADGHSLFTLNGADPVGAELLRHAIIDLQAKLEGSALPRFVLDDQVKH